MKRISKQTSHLFIPACPRAWQIILAISFLVCLVDSPVTANAEDTLHQVRSRGVVRCGVNEGLLGFSIKGADGNWTGMDADFCRAVAAAVLGDPQKASFVPLIASARFPALRNGEIDLLARNTTWTLSREANLGVLFAGVLHYDAQAVMVPAKSGARDLSALAGKKICVGKGSTHESHLAEYFHSREWNFTPLVMNTRQKAVEALFSGECDAYSSDASQLAAIRRLAPGGPEAFVILPEALSEEPLGPAVKQGDDKWFTIVRWVLAALVAAEECGITRDSVDAQSRKPQSLAAERFFTGSAAAAKALGLEPGWASRAVAGAGNYGEMFDRNLGGGSALKLDRGLDRLWREGGLMYAPPFQ